MKDNKNRQKRKKTGAEKEQIFINISTKILVAVTLIVAVVYAVISIKNQFSSSGLKALEELGKEPDTSTIITRPITDELYTSLNTKITNSGFDILVDGDIDYEKFCQTTIAINDNLSLASNELGLLYNSIHLTNPDKYSMIVKQIDTEVISNGYKLKIVCTVDMRTLFPSVPDVPARVYITSESEIKSGVITPLKTIYNNMSTSLSDELSTAINDQEDKPNIQNYIPSLIVNFMKNIVQKTDTTLSVSNNQVAFNLKTA